MTVFEREPRKVVGVPIPGMYKTTDRPVPIEGKSYPVRHEVDDSGGNYPPRNMEHTFCIAADLDRRTVRFYEISQSLGDYCLEEGRIYELSGYEINDSVSPIKDLVEYVSD